MLRGRPVRTAGLLGLRVRRAVGHGAGAVLPGLPGAARAAVRRHPLRQGTLWSAVLGRSTLRRHAGVRRRSLRPARVPAGGGAGVLVMGMVAHTCLDRLRRPGRARCLCSDPA
ncbi:hypothetical protein GCM10023167_09380 [Brevibacterium pityocampae]|uniref:DUF4184 domain-containing protein n=1 Tax=Brevibacterium pityocampae TaxID=506594 RepID=A0ABP8J7M5_9MICO